MTIAVAMDFLVCAGPPARWMLPTQPRRRGAPGEACPPSASGVPRSHTGSSFRFRGASLRRELGQRLAGMQFALVRMHRHLSRALAVPWRLHHFLFAALAPL